MMLNKAPGTTDSGHLYLFSALCNPAQSNGDNWRCVARGFAFVIVFSTLAALCSSGTAASTGFVRTVTWTRIAYGGFGMS